MLKETVLKIVIIFTLVSATTSQMVYPVPESVINEPCKGDQGIVLYTEDCKDHRNGEFSMNELYGYVENVGFVVCCIKTTPPSDLKRTTKPPRKVGEEAKKYCKKHGINKPLLVEKHLFGGSPSEVGEFPHHVQIFYRKAGETETGCGGSLISDRFVITAAHCLNSNKNGVPVYVRMGRVRELRYFLFI
jgi:hypothetical protein